MANFMYNEAKRMLLAGELDWDSNDIRVALVMTNTTADTEDDVNLMNAFSTLDEYDGTNYARQAVANESIGEDAANDRAEGDGDDVTFTSLGAGTRNCQAALVYKHVTDDTDSIPLLYIDTGGFPFAGSGSNVTIQWNAEGIVQVG